MRKVEIGHTLTVDHSGMHLNGRTFRSAEFYLVLAQSTKSILSGMME